MKFNLLLILLFASLVFAQFPQPAGFVNDYANILPNRAEFELGIVEYEKNTTIEVAVVTIEALLQDHTTATYAVELFAKWGIGKKGQDNGLLILIVKNGTIGNRMRIEVGYGLQGYITGAEAGRILDTALPYYEQGDYEAALDMILIGLSDQLDSYVPGKQVNNINMMEDFIIPNLPMLIFGAFLILSVGMSNRCPYCIRGRIDCKNDVCVCSRCKKRFTRRRRYAPYIPGGFHGGGGGFGGFGGGGSGGGGAGR